MNWLQDRLMMSSTVAATPAPGAVTAPPPNMFPTSSPSSTNSSPAGPAQMSYEARMAMYPPHGHQPFQNQFTANLNFNLTSYKPKEVESSESFESNNLSPSSGTGSPRTDETLDKTSDNVEADTSGHEADLSGLEMLRQHANNIPKPAPGLSIRQDIQTNVGKKGGEREEDEINDAEENEEELLIDEEMEENSRDKHEETFEEVPMDKMTDSLKQFSNFQPYLNMKEAAGAEAGSAAINSLEKLQQVSVSKYLNIIYLSSVVITFHVGQLCSLHIIMIIDGRTNSLLIIICISLPISWKATNNCCIWFTFLVSNRRKNIY